MKANVLGLAAAVALAAGAAEAATGLAYSGYLTKFGGGNEPLALGVRVSGRSSAEGKLWESETVQTRMETNGYVAVTVTCEVSGDTDTVVWTFSLGDKSETVTQALPCAPCAVVAERAEKIVPTKRSLTVDGALRADEADALRTLSVGTWGAPGAKVELGGETAESFAVENLATRMDVDRASAGCPARVELLGAPDTNGTVRAEIRGGVSVSDEGVFAAPSDGILEVTLKGVVSYSRNAAYGDYPDQDGLCHVCAMVGMDLTDENGRALMKEVFGAFRPDAGITQGGDSSKKLMCRPWIVPTSELTARDGKMTSRLTVPMRRGDRFRVCLEFANFTVSGDRAYAGRSFVTMEKPSWVDGGSWAMAELTYRAIGGEK